MVFEMMNLENIKQIWDQGAKEQGKFLLGELEATRTVWEKLLAEKLFPLRSGEVLDMGCGTGFLSLLLAEMGFRIMAVDVSGAMLKEAVQAADLLGVSDRIRFVQTDVSALDFEPARFEAIVSRHASWLFTQPELVYQSCARLLKKDGILLNFDANWLLPIRNEQIKKLFEEDEKALIDKFGEFQDYYHQKELMSVLNQLPTASKDRPIWDKTICEAAGFSEVEISHLSDESLWDPFFAIRYRHTPTFVVRAKK